MTLAYPIWQKYMCIWPWSNSLGPFQTSLDRSPKILWLTSFHNMYLFLGNWLTFALGMNIPIRCVHSTYLRTMLHTHIPLSSYHLGLTRTLGSCTTCKLMGCGLVYPLVHVVFIFQVYLMVSTRDLYHNPPKPGFMSCGGSSGVFPSSIIVATKSKVFCA